MELSTAQQFSVRHAIGQRKLRRIISFPSTSGLIPPMESYAAIDPDY
jgi:hypothetical protein